jgi:hypothetical protein
MLLLPASLVFTPSRYRYEIVLTRSLVELAKVDALSRKDRAHDLSTRPSLIEANIEAFLSGDRHIYAEATCNTMHCASRDTTSSGTRMNSTLSHDACSSRPFSRLFPVFAASV